MDSTIIVLQTWRPQIRCFSSIGLVRMWPYPTSPFAVPHRAPLPSPTEIGGLAAGEGNEIWGNSQACIRVSGNGATDNKILGNLIGPVAGTGYLGKVKRITDFGAFVEIFPGTDGLIHISHLAKGRVDKVTDVLMEGDEVLAKCIDIDPSGRIRLSRKEALADTEAKAAN